MFVLRLLIVFIVMMFAGAISGHGQVVLDIKKPLESQLIREGECYLIDKALNLNGKTVKLPKGSTLEFKSKGCLTNGRIVGNETLIKNPKLQKVRFGGSFINTEINLSDEFDGETDFWGLLQAFPSAEIILAKDIILPESNDKSIEIRHFHLNGKRHTVTVRRFPVLKYADVLLVNTIFDCRKARERVISATGENESRKFIVKNCTFKNVPEVFTLWPKLYKDVVIEECSIYGILNDNSKSTIKNISQIRVQGCIGSVVVRRNTISNCFGTGISGCYFKPEDKTNVLFEENRIDHVTGGGIIFVSGAVRNAIVRGNHITRTHTLGIQFEDEIDGGPNSSINFHGFYNALVENNVIENCPNSFCFDFDGSFKGKDYIAKGKGLIVRGNKVLNSGPVALFVVEDVDFSCNRFEGRIYHRTNSAILVMGARDVKISRNDFNYSLGEGDAVYPIYARDIKKVSSGKLQIEDNKISTDGNDFLYLNSDFTGECMVRRNAIGRVGSKDGNLNIINKSRAKVTVVKNNRIMNIH